MLEIAAETKAAIAVNVASMLAALNRPATQLERMTAEAISSLFLRATRPVAIAVAPHGGLPALTRRRYHEVREDCWHIFYGDIHAGTIIERIGNPL